MEKYTSKKQTSLQPAEKHQTSLAEKLLMGKKILLGGLEFEVTKIINQKGESIKKIDLEWRQDVRVPLRQCDYEKPLICRVFPSQDDSREDELTLSLVAQIVLVVPFWRRFIRWPGRRAIPAAYAELRRLLLEYGYSPKDFEKCSIADIAELLSEGHYRAETQGLLQACLLEEGYSGPLPSDSCLGQFAGRSIDEIVKIIKNAGKYKPAAAEKTTEAERNQKKTSDGQVPILKLIEQGECDSLEFKETLEYDTKQKEKNKDVLLSSLKTIAAFLNSESGGTLLIGVDDSGKIIGIERDLNLMKAGNADRFEQKIRNCLKDRFKPQPIGKIEISFEKFNERTVCCVDVQKSKEIIHLDGEVYVRDGNTTQKLEGRALTDWIQQRKN